LDPGSSPAFPSASMYFAEVPKSVQRSAAAKSKSAPASGWNGALGWAERPRPPRLARVERPPAAR
ncbi:MAG: hypothetical protein ACE1ZT_00015, partial [Dehalococcoidia bacterium]